MSRCAGRSRSDSGSAGTVGVGGACTRLIGRGRSSSGSCLVSSCSGRTGAIGVRAVDAGGSSWGSSVRTGSSLAGDSNARSGCASRRARGAGLRTHAAAGTGRARASAGSGSCAGSRACLCRRPCRCREHEHSCDSHSFHLVSSVVEWPTLGRVNPELVG